MTWLKFGSTLALVLSFSSAFAAPATVATLDEIRKQTHYTMGLTGWIDIDASGAVTAHRLDQHVATLPSSVVTAISRAVAGWRFAPHASGTAMRAPMKLRLEAQRTSGGGISEPRIDAAQFGEVPPEERVTFAKQPGKRARYSSEMYYGGVSGGVHLAVRVGRDGKPMQVVAEQVNLTVVDSEAGMERWRRELGELGVRTAQRWRFIPPSSGPSASKSDWTMRVPVHFLAGGQQASGYGQWQLYIPGPKHEIPWDEASDPGIVGDSASEDEVGGSALRLLTPLDPAPAS